MTFILEVNQAVNSFVLEISLVPYSLILQVDVVTLVCINQSINLDVSFRVGHQTDGHNIGH